MLTVGELREALKDVPDDAVVVVPAFPSAFRPLTRAVVQTLFATEHDPGRFYSEEPKDGKKLDAIVLL